MSNKKRLLIGLTTLAAAAFLIAGSKLFLYYTEPLPVLVKFKPNVAQEQAVATAGKYNTDIQKQKHVEYNNPAFGFLYPFSQSHVIEFEISRINAGLVADKIRKEDGVETVGIFKVSFEATRAYEKLFESLNPDLKSQ